MALLDVFTGQASKAAAKNNLSAIGNGLTASYTALGQGYDTAGSLLGIRDGGNALTALGKGYDQARTDITNQYGQTQGFLSKLGEVYQPLVQQGGGAYSAYGDAIGANGPEGSARATESFRAAPGYQYTTDQALEAVQRSAAARGGLAGGNTTADILKTATGLADQGYQQYISNLKDGSGFYTAGVTGQAGALTGQAGASQNQGTALGALGTGMGSGAASLYGLGSNQQAQFGQGLAGLQTGAANALVSNNNQLAKAETDASANLLGGILGGASNIFSSAGQAGGFSKLFK